MAFSEVFCVMPAYSGERVTLTTNRGINIFKMNKFFTVVDTFIAKPKPKPRRTIRQVLVDFYYMSTAHGISHAAAARTRISRWFWIIVFCICMCILCVQLYMILNKFMEYPYTVQVDVRYEQLAYPAVTVCNLNPFKNSLTEKTEVGKTLKITSSNIAKAAAKGRHSSRSIRIKRQETNSSVEHKREPEIIPRSSSARFFPVYAECVCEINESGEKAEGSCFPVHKGTIGKDFVYPRNRFRKSVCICDYDKDYKSAWPCFPSIAWKSKMCIHCDEYGHCPMRFWDSNKHIGQVHRCLCHDDFNHCVIDLETDVPNIKEISHDSGKPYDENIFGPTTPSTTTTTTTPEPEHIEALGFDEEQGELATKAKGTENLVFSVAAMTDTEKESLSYNQNELILQCSFNSQDCDPYDFKLHIDPSYGNCYTFNHNSTRNPPLRASRAGATYGLRVLVYSNASDYLPTTEAVGVRVCVHSPTVVPFPDAFGYSAPVGTLSSFGLKLRKFSRLPAPYGDCLVDTYNTKGFIYQKEYTVEGCFRSCFQNELVRQCGCGDPRFPVSEGNVTCSTTNTTARKCLNNATANMGDVGSVLSCQCKQPCSESAFDITFSNSIWPSPATQVAECITGDEICLERYRRNAAMVQVYYEQLNYETLTEEPVYVVANLLSDFGGQLGLWLGLSVISGLEFIMFLYDLAKTAYLDRKDKKKKMKDRKSYDPSEIQACLCECPTDSDGKTLEAKTEQIMASAYVRKLAKTSFGAAFLGDSLNEEEGPATNHTKKESSRDINDNRQNQEKNQLNDFAAALAGLR